MALARSLTKHKNLRRHHTLAHRGESLLQNSEVNATAASEDSGDDVADGANDADDDADSDADDDDGSDVSPNFTVPAHVGDTGIKATVDLSPEVSMNYTVPPHVDDTGTQAEKARFELNLHKAKEALAANLKEQVAVNLEMNELDDELKSHAEIATTVKAVTNETNSPNFANFLGDMWVEMRMFSKPFYKEHLEEKLAGIVAKGVKLQANFDEAKAILTSWTPRVADLKSLQ